MFQMIFYTIPIHKKQLRLLAPTECLKNFQIHNNGTFSFFVLAPGRKRGSAGTAGPPVVDAQKSTMVRSVAP